MNNTISITMMVYNIEIVVGLNDPQQVQNEEDDCNNEQCVDPTACLRETWAYAPTEIAE
jgi:hypothetical protein